MFYSDIVLKAKDYVKKILLSHNIDKEHWYYYHNLNHTLDVFQRASYLAKKEWLNEDLQELIQLSALFHDTWFIEQYDNNEPIWAKIAENFFKDNKFPEDKIDIIKNIILATIPTKQPLSHLEEIIKDADIDNLWRDDFFEKNNDLYKEIKNTKKMDIDNKKWLENSLSFIENCNFYTETSQKERAEQFTNNIEKLKENLKNL